MKKWTMWAAVALGALGIAFLSGAFENFFQWDHEESSVASGLFTAGVAVAGAYLAHSTGIIDGNTRNLLVTAGIAVGAYNSIGMKAYDWGSELAGKMRKGGSTKRKTGTDGLPMDSDRDVVPDGLDGFAGQPGFGGGNPGVPSGLSGLSQSPVYNINVEAAKIPKPNIGLELGKTAIDSGFAALGSIFGSKGAGNRALAYV